MKKNKRKKIEKNKFIISNKKAQKIINKALKNNYLLWIKSSAWGNRKALNKSLLKEKFKDNASALSGAQKLVDHNEVKKVTTPINRVINFIRLNSFPWLTEGIYFVTEKQVSIIEEKCKETRKEVKERRAEFKKKYPLLKKEHAKKYPELYNEMHYPNPNEVERRFDFIWGWQKINLPFSNDSKNINIVSEDMANNENIKFKEMMKGVAEDTIIMIRNSFMELISKMQNTLKEPNKKFKNSTIENPIKFLEQLKEINIYNDKPFEDVANDMMKTLKGIDIENLRDDKKYRKKVSKEVKEIVTEFEQLPTVKYKRSLEF